MPTCGDEIVGDVRVGGRSEGRAPVVAVLASFLPPVRAGREAARLGGHDTSLEQAVALLRDRYGASAVDLAVALDSAGVGAVAVAHLVGADPVSVNRWLDEADDTHRR